MKEGDILMEQLHKGRQAFSYAFPIMIPMGKNFWPGAVAHACNPSTLGG